MKDERQHARADKRLEKYIQTHVLRCQRVAQRRLEAAREALHNDTESDGKEEAHLGL